MTIRSSLRHFLDGIGSLFDWFPIRKRTTKFPTPTDAWRDVGDVIREQQETHRKLWIAGFSAQEINRLVKKS